MNWIRKLVLLIVHRVVDERTIFGNLSQISIQFEVVLALAWYDDRLTRVEAKIAIETRLKSSCSHDL